MGLGNRVGARHETAATKVAVRSEDWWDFRPGQRVMTVDGYPGRVEAVLDGPHPGNEDYQVTLDHGLGGGTYTASQLRQATETTSSVHTAADDYPELGNVLSDRPDIAPNTVLGSKAGMAAEAVERSHLTHDHQVPSEFLDPSMTEAESDQWHDWQHRMGDPQDAWSHDHQAPDSSTYLGSREAGVRDVVRNLFSRSPKQQAPSVAGPTTPVCQGCNGHRVDYYGKPCVSCGGSGTPNGQRLHSPPPAQPPSAPHSGGEDWKNYFTGSAKEAVHPPEIGQVCSACHQPSAILHPIPTPERGVMHFCPTCVTQGFNGTIDATNPTQFAPNDAPYFGMGRSLSNPHAFRPLGPEDHHRTTLSSVSDTAVPMPCTSCQGRGEIQGQRCPMCGGSGIVPKLKTGAAEFDPFDMLVTAASDPSFRFHVTATWNDVRRKAQRLRSEGKVNIVAAQTDAVAANVQGDHHVYETVLQRHPNSRMGVAAWQCGCKWAAYSWGRSGRWRRFEGRMCSHALALQYEAQSRGMFGRDVSEDKTTPAWLRPRTRVVEQYDRDEKRNHSRPAQPRMVDQNRQYRASLESDQLSPLDYLLVTAAVDREDPWDVAVALGAAGIDRHGFITEAKDKKHPRPPSPKRWVPGWGYGWGWCGQCSGSGCGHCAGTGLTGGPDGGEPSGSASTDGSGGGSATAQATNPGQDFPNQPGAVPQGPGVWNATAPRDVHENPASAGFASGRDPQNWSAPSTGNAMMASLHDGLEDSFEPMLDKEAAFLAVVPELLGGAAAAGEAGAAAGGAGSMLPGASQIGRGLMTHEVVKGLTGDGKDGGDGGGQQKTYQAPHAQDDTDAAQARSEAAYPTDAFYRQSAVAEMHDEPEPALPRTDGAEGDDDDELDQKAHSTPAAKAVASAGSVEEILANFQRTAGAGLMSGGSAAVASAEQGDIAQAAMAHLAKTSLKAFTPAEQQALINEGQGVTASNLDRLDISGTHYQALEALQNSGEDDDSWMS